MAIQTLNFTVDLNNDGAYSLWELWLVAKELYRVPGNLAVEGLGNIPVVAEWLNIRASEATGYASLNGTLAVLISLLFWTALLFTALSYLSPDAGTETEPEEQHTKTQRQQTSQNPGVTHTHGAAERHHKHHQGPATTLTHGKVRPASLTGHLVNKPRRFAHSRLRRPHHNMFFYKRSRPPI